MKRQLGSALERDASGRLRRSIQKRTLTFFLLHVIQPALLRVYLGRLRWTPAPCWIV
jgi:hypothetical protein